MADEERDFDDSIAQYNEAPTEYTPVRPRRGRLVHATSLSGPNETSCGRKFEGWIAVAKPLTCRDCMMAVGLDVRPKETTKRPKRNRS